MARSGGLVTIGLVAASLHAFADPSTYLAALEVERQKEAEIQQIAAKMNVDPEFLLHPGGRKSFDFHSVFASVANALGIHSEEAVVNNAQPENIRESIAKVKERYALVAADTTLAEKSRSFLAARGPRRPTRARRTKAG